jgi:hypothetical protein
MKGKFCLFVGLALAVFAAAQDGVEQVNDEQYDACDALTISHACTVTDSSGETYAGYCDYDTSDALFCTDVGNNPSTAACTDYAVGATCSYYVDGGDQVTGTCEQHDEADVVFCITDPDVVACLGLDTDAYCVIYDENEDPLYEGSCSEETTNGFNLCYFGSSAATAATDACADLQKGDDCTYNSDAAFGTIEGVCAENQDTMSIHCTSSIDQDAYNACLSSYLGDYCYVTTSELDGECRTNPYHGLVYCDTDVENIESVVECDGKANDENCDVTTSEGYVFHGVCSTDDTSSVVHCLRDDPAEEPCTGMEENEYCFYQDPNNELVSGHCQSSSGTMLCGDSGTSNGETNPAASACLSILEGDSCSITGISSTGECVTHGVTSELYCEIDFAKLVCAQLSESTFCVYQDDTNTYQTGVCEYNDANYLSCYTDHDTNPAVAACSSATVEGVACSLQNSDASITYSGTCTTDPTVDMIFCDTTSTADNVAACEDKYEGDACTVGENYFSAGTCQLSAYLGVNWCAMSSDVEAINVCDGSTEGDTCRVEVDIATYNGTCGTDEEINSLYCQRIDERIAPCNGKTNNAYCTYSDPMGNILGGGCTYSFDPETLYCDSDSVANPAVTACDGKTKGDICSSSDLELTASSAFCVEHMDTGEVYCQTDPNLYACHELASGAYCTVSGDSGTCYEDPLHGDITCDTTLDDAAAACEDAITEGDSCSLVRPDSTDGVAEDGTCMQHSTTGELYCDITSNLAEVSACDGLGVGEYCTLVSGNVVLVNGGSCVYNSYSTYIECLSGEDINAISACESLNEDDDCSVSTSTDEVWAGSCTRHVDTGDVFCERIDTRIPACEGREEGEYCFFTEPNLGTTASGMCSYGSGSNLGQTLFCSTGEPQDNEALVSCDDKNEGEGCGDGGVCATLIANGEVYCEEDPAAYACHGMTQNDYCYITADDGSLDPGYCDLSGNYYYCITTGNNANLEACENAATEGTACSIDSITDGVVTGTKDGFCYYHPGTNQMYCDMATAQEDVRACTDLYDGDACVLVQSDLNGDAESRLGTCTTNTATNYVVCVTEGEVYAQSACTGSDEGSSCSVAEVANGYSGSCVYEAETGSVYCEREDVQVTACTNKEVNEYCTFYDPNGAAAAGYCISSLTLPDTLVCEIDSSSNPAVTLCDDSAEGDSCGDDGETCVVHQDTQEMFCQSDLEELACTSLSEHAYCVHDDSSGSCETTASGTLSCDTAAENDATYACETASVGDSCTLDEHSGTCAQHDNTGDVYCDAAATQDDVLACEGKNSGEYCSWQAGAVGAFNAGSTTGYLTGSCQLDSITGQVKCIPETSSLATEACTGSSEGSDCTVDNEDDGVYYDGSCIYASGAEEMYCEHNAQDLADACADKNENDYCTTTWNTQDGYCSADSYYGLLCFFDIHEATADSETTQSLDACSTHQAGDKCEYDNGSGGIIDGICMVHSESGTTYCEGSSSVQACSELSGGDYCYDSTTETAGSCQTHETNGDTECNGEGQDAAAAATACSGKSDGDTCQFTIDDPNADNFGESATGVCATHTESTDVFCNQDVASAAQCSEAGTACFIVSPDTGANIAGLCSEHDNNGRLDCAAEAVTDEIYNGASYSTGTRSDAGAVAGGFIVIILIIAAGVVVAFVVIQRRKKRGTGASLYSDFNNAETTI